MQITSKCILALLFVTGVPNPVRASTATLSKPQAASAAGGPVVIYYGLNESHSRSWAQINDNGVVGVSYFQHYDGSHTDGTLFYRAYYLDGSEDTDSVTTGTRLEKSVLLYDESSRPHIFVAISDDTDQIIEHYYKSDLGQWQSETIVHFYNEGGKFIYELSADTGPDYSFHLAILKTRSDVDSNDFWDAWIGANLYYLTNSTGVWAKELIHHYDTAWTEDMYIKSSSRQDIKIDEDGHAHVTFSEQVIATETPSRLLYATNKTGVWTIETALSYDYGPSDDAGWFPSLCLDNYGTPYITCMYVNRVATLSATYCKLFFLKRLGVHNWSAEIIADRDDGYYGGDGRKYTGALSHLVFDGNNTPHVVFSDIASTHWPGSQLLNVGNIRYGKYEEGHWIFTTIYRQPLPTAFLNATEMHGMCLAICEDTGTLRVVGQELVVTGEYQYTCNLLNFAWDTRAPATPTGFVGTAKAGGLELTWAANLEGDLSHYALYRGNAPDFIPGPENLVVETTDTSAVDSTWTPAGYFYKLAAADVYDNESDYALLFPGDIVPTLLNGYNATAKNRHIEITWTLSESRIDDIAVYRSEGLRDNFQELASRTIFEDNLTYSFFDYDCKPGRDYYYRVDVLDNNERRILFETDALYIAPLSHVLYQNHPNPFNPTTTISFEIVENAHVDLSIYDLTGTLVRTLLNEHIESGYKQMTWNGTDELGNHVSSGVYFCRLKSGKRVMTRKMVLLK